MSKKITIMLLSFFLLHGNYFLLAKEAEEKETVKPVEEEREMSKKESYFYRVMGFKAPFKYSVVSERFNALDVKPEKQDEGENAKEAQSEEMSSAEEDFKAVILVKDHHSYYPAQENIAATLNFLSANMPFIRSFLFEGAVGEIDLSIFRAFNNYNIRKDMSKFLLKGGFVSAGEDMAIANLGIDFRLYGIENLNVYNKHVDTFLEFMADFSVLKGYLDNIDSVSRYLKYSLFSETAIKFLEKKKEYYDFKSVGLNDYAIYLRNKAVNFDIDYKQFSNFSTYMELLKYDSIINYIKIRAATDDIISDLQTRISKEDFNDLLSRNLKHNQGIISETEYYGFIRELMELYKVKVRPTHILARYFTYLDIKANIDFDILREEISALEYFIVSELLRDELQNLLYKMMSEYDLFKKFLKFESLPADVEKVKKAVLDFFQLNITFQSLFLSIFKGDRLKDIDFSAKYMQEKMLTAEKFYELAAERDNYLLYNIESFMQVNEESFPLVFLGEFHVRSIADMLRAKNISYIVIEPKIKSRDNRVYLKRMNGSMPLDVFFTEAGQESVIGDSNLAPYIYLSDYFYTEELGDAYRRDLFYLYAVFRVMRSLDAYKQRVLMGAFNLKNPEFYEMVNANIQAVIETYLSGRSISERVDMGDLAKSLLIKPESCHLSQGRISFVLGNTRVILEKAIGVDEQKEIIYNGFLIKKITEISE